MGKFNLLNAIFLVLLLASCSDTALDLIGSSVANPTGGKECVVYPKKLGTRAGTINDNNWESWENVWLGNRCSVPVPWNRQGFPGAIPIEIARDIKAVDGWELIAHTLTGSNATDYNYLVFHNKYSGVLKVFNYFESGGLQNYAVWKIHMETPQSSFAFLGDLGELSSKRDVFDAYVTNITNDDTKGFVKGWNCFQIELAYDPNFDGGVLQLMPFTRKVEKLVLDGVTESETNGMIVSTTNNNFLNTPVKEMAKYAGKEAEDWVQKRLEDEDVFKKLSSVLIKGAGSIVTSGVSTLLGSFIGGFNKQQETTQAVQLSTNGTLSLSGTAKAEETGLIPPLTLDVSISNVGRLGAWCMKTMPYITLDPYAVYQYEPNYPSNALYQLSIYDKNHIQGTVELNPDMASDIKSSKVSAKLFCADKTIIKDALKTNSLRRYVYKTSATQQLYDKVYTTPVEILVDVPLKDENGDVVNVGEVEPPIEVFLPDAPDGTKGAVPDFTFDSKYISVVTVTITTKEDDTVVLVHTFPVNVKWEYSLFNNGIYLDTYPCVPLEKKNN